MVIDMSRILSKINATDTVSLSSDTGWLISD